MLFCNISSYKGICGQVPEDTAWTLSVVDFSVLKVEVPLAINPK